MKRSGFTTIEMVIVVVLIGLIAAIGFPKIRQSLDKANVRSARAAVGTLAATARAAAIQRGCPGVIHFLATNARFGPSMMPGGDPESWKHLKPIWEAVAAKVDPKTGKPLENYAPGKPVAGGVPCTAYLGPNGAGHYVKMVHNGIEYIDMQLIGEAYWLMHELLGMKAPELSKVFNQWNEGDLDSYLIQITADILQQPDPVKQGTYLVDNILDTAGQKGTGKWTSTN